MTGRPEVKMDEADEIYLGIMSHATKEMIDGFPVDFPRWAEHTAASIAMRLRAALSAARPEAQEGDDRYHIDAYYGLLWALRDLPEIPSPQVLLSLSLAGRWPEDVNEGKRIQRERGLEVVPPKTECEIGAGVWHRVVRPVGAPPPQSDAKQGG